MNSPRFMLILFIHFLWISLVTKSQCAPAPPAASACSGGNGAGSNGITVNGGQTFWFTGGPATWPGGITMNGGTFRVCGSLTLNGINFNSGTIIIENGGSLIVNTGADLYLNGSSNICNRGFFSLNTNLRMQNANNTVWNMGSSASLNVAGQLEINSSTSKVINSGGHITAGSIVVQGSASAGAVCMQVGSCFTCNGGTNSIINNFTNGWVFSGSGMAAVTFNGNAQLNNAFTANSNVVICRNAGASTSGSGGWGAATLTLTPCPNCSVALPVELLYFKSDRCDDKICFVWATASEVNNDYFTIEYSENGLDFNALANIDGAGHSLDKTEYRHSVSTRDIAVDADVLYFRLTQTDHSGATSHSHIVSLENVMHGTEISIFPNPFSDEIIVNAKENSWVEIMHSGNCLISQAASGGKTTIVHTQSLSGGVYFLLLKNKDGLVYCSKKLVK